MYMYTHYSGFFFSPDVENQQIMSLKYTVIMLRLRQNKRNRGCDIVVAGTNVKVLHVGFVAPDLFFIISFYGTTRQKTLLKHPGRHEVRQLRRDWTVNYSYAITLLSSGSSRHL